MTADLMPFEYVGTAVRVVLIDGEPWFVLADLCKVLGLSNPSAVAQRIDGAALSQAEVSSSGQRRQVSVVNESGMYEVVIRSDKPEAVAFRRWITGTVLPEIRRTGSYRPVPALAGPELVAAALIEANRMLGAKDQRIAELEPKAEFFDELMSADGTYTMQAAANILGWGRNVMMRELRKLGVLQGNRLPYRRFAHHFKVVPGTRVHPRTGEIIPTATTHVLPSGVDFLRRKLEQSVVMS